MTLSIEQLLLETSETIEQEISSLLPKGDDQLYQAMRYSALSSGKRLRPFMLLSTADMFGVKREYSLRVAATIEIIHSYSLIHDDLPAMDDDDFRRGLPSCHKKFDEATAILAGDSLLTLAFEILADKATCDDSDIRCQLIKILAQNIGYDGMAGGQMSDLIYERHTSPNYEEVLKMHWMKTAKLFMGSCLMGAKLGSASTKEQEHLAKYGEYFGLAFQFIDDLEDVAEGKTLSNNNVVKIIGYEETKIKAIELISKAKDELISFNQNANILTSLADQLESKI
jgi:farnesyl diphosphate synthase